MARYELINPSDDYTFEAPDDSIAEVVATLTSTMAGWRSLDGEDRQGGLAELAHRDDMDEYVAMVTATVDERRAEVVAGLRSLEIASERRKRLGVDPNAWHDEMRTSLSDYRAKALQLADHIEAAVAAS